MERKDIVSVAKELAEMYFRGEFDDVHGELSVKRDGITNAALAIETYRLIESVQPGMGSRFAASVFKKVS